MKDTYKTIAFSPEEILFKEKGSKFFGYAFPITSEEEVKPIIEVLRKKTSNGLSLLLRLPNRHRKNQLQSQ